MRYKEYLRRRYLLTNAHVVDLRRCSQKVVPRLKCGGKVAGMTQITPKENFLNVLVNHADPVWTPVMGMDCKTSGFASNWLEKGPVGGGKDGFGVTWEAPASGGGAPIPRPGDFMFDFDDMPEWEEYVHFPNLDDMDWRAHAEASLTKNGEKIDRNTYALSYGIGNGPYERIAALIGFENTLLALAEYPDDTKRLAEAIVDWKLEQVKYVKKWIDPDIIINYDDFCTQRSPFFSPEAYREVFLPVNTRYYQGIRDQGIIPVQHTCGYATSLVDMIIESGAQAWASVQPCNPISDLIDKYGDRFTFIGGYDTVGPCSLPDATDEEIAEEAYRCIREYGMRKGYIFFGFRLLNTTDPVLAAREYGRILNPAIKFTHEWAGVPYEA